MKNIYSILFVFTLSLVLVSCQTVEQKLETPVPITEGTKESREFFEMESKYSEVFKIFVSTEDYIARQLLSKETIQLKEDKRGDKYFQEQLQPFNKIDYFGYVVAKVELYQDSGKISRVRPIRSSGIQQIDQMVLEDILRFQFVFPQKKVTPYIFYLDYAIQLSKEKEKK